MNNILAIIKKQIKDTFKNKTVFSQFVLMPLIAILMERFIKPGDVPDLFFTKMFSVMYMGMAPLTAMAAIIAEEKEKNTLRVLMMSNVKPWQYLVGVGSYVWMICMLGVAAFCTNGIKSEDIPFYMVFMGCGFIISIVAGACVGIFAKNQMAATSLVTALMFVLAFIPMFAQFNEKISKVAKFVYTQQIRLSLDAMTFSEIKSNGIVILIANALIATVLFFVIFRKKGLE